ncbi:5746_t:CDS:2 [Cetraspora pellucida]|uniref:5746_t:CDS:1 n=1 Tax=Cetraspora pellucida TaxID=1433469 RepID=A0A9N9FJ90_9GLOM|nr:5746_t:CDS:2 [Cetraspora pellucida]
MSFISHHVTKRNIGLPKLKIHHQADISKVRKFVPLNSGYSRCNVSDNDPFVIDKEKRRLLRGKVVGPFKHAPGWNEKLASDSEAMVKAEREPDSTSIDELQRETLTYLTTHDNENDDIVVETFKKEVEVKHHDKSSEVSESAEWKMNIK